MEYSTLSNTKIIEVKAFFIKIHNHYTQGTKVWEILQKKLIQMKKRSFRSMWSRGTKITLLSNPRSILKWVQCLIQNYGIREKLPCLIHNSVTDPEHNLHSLVKGITKQQPQSLEEILVFMCSTFPKLLNGVLHMPYLFPHSLLIKF